MIGPASSPLALFYIMERLKVKKYNYLNAAPGGGKTHWANNYIINNPARYLIVRDRLDAIAEHVSSLSTIPTRIITSAQQKCVRSAIRDAPCWHHEVHQAVFITHNAMLMSDFSEWEGWHIIIDETPSIFFEFESVTNISADFFAKNYKLTPVKKLKDWHQIELSEAGFDLSPSEIAADEALRVFRPLHEKIAASTVPPKGMAIRKSKQTNPVRNPVLINIGDFDEMRDRRRWSAWSNWSIEALAPFESVTIMANNFDQSLTFKTIQKLHPKIEWNAIEIEPRNYRKRAVHIEYFAANHTASRYLFESAKGQENLRKIAKHLSKETEQIVTCNESMQPYLAEIGGKKMSPIQSGSNRYDHLHRATMLYSAKPSPEIITILEAIGLSGDHWIESVEYEAILQFMCRTSVRDPNSTAPVTFRVYDARQAGFLARFFRSLPHCEVTMELVDLGFAEMERNVGRPKLEFTPEEAEARKVADKAAAARRAKEYRARKKAAKAAA